MKTKLLGAVALAAAMGNSCAFADVVNFPEAVTFPDVLYTYAIAGLGGSGPSTTPVSFSTSSLAGWGVAASSNPGAAGAAVVGSVNGASALQLPGVNAEMKYYFEPLGIVGTPVLVHYQFHGSAEAAVDTNGGIGGAFAKASASGTISGAGASIHVELCATSPFDTCSTINPWHNGSGLIMAIAGSQYTVDLLAGAGGDVDCVGCTALANAQIDPYLWIDPLQASQFSLAISPGIPNIPFATTVPEPSTWAMMLLGFAGLAYAGYRRTSAVRVAWHRSRRRLRSAAPSASGRWPADAIAERNDAAERADRANRIFR